MPCHSRLTRPKVNFFVVSGLVHRTKPPFRISASSNAITTVSQFFSDKVGAAPASHPSPAGEINTSPRKRPTLLQRLQIHTSGRFARSPVSSPGSEPKSTFRAGPQDYTGSPVAARASFSNGSDADLAELVRIMPQALAVGDSSLAGTSAKRQRSADSREVSTRPTSAGRKASAVSLSKSNVRIPQYLDKSKADISTAFQDLEWKQRFRLFHALENPTTSPFRVDRSDVVISRNRYGNVQPWDNSRIMLQPPIAGSDYVNASPIILRSRSVASKTDASSQSNDNIAEQSFQENKYIATQGPKQGLISHFWRMVMQETTGDTGVVVMLTQCYEANKEKCARYFPADLSDPIIVLPREEQEVDTPDTAATESEDDADRENSHAHPVEGMLSASSSIDLIASTRHVLTVKF